VKVKKSVLLRNYVLARYTYSKRSSLPGKIECSLSLPPREVEKANICDEAPREPQRGLSLAAREAAEAEESW